LVSQVTTGTKGGGKGGLKVFRRGLSVTNDKVLEKLYI